ncbi:hypothetical protein M758_3G113400 [Ceratodon purpureus]|nr:hypothetical protein M758_3G113400 [Ceratodon purpureus]
MEVDAVANGVAALEVEDSCGAVVVDEGREGKVEAEGEGGVAAAKSSKKKKKKKKVNSHGPDSSAEVFQALPSQKLVESLFPWTAVMRPRRGRCAIAARDIKAGEAVVVEQAVAFVPRSQDRTSVCHECCRDLHRDVRSVECSRCKYAVYCQDCEESAMASHSKWCKVSQQIKEVAKMSDCDDDLLRFVMALALKRPLHNNDGGVGILKDGVIHSTIQDALALQTHEGKATSAWKASVRRGCNLLLSNWSLYSEVTENVTSTGSQFATLEELETLALLVNTNAHGMGSQGIHNADVALGMFPFVSMLNHSCWPNCCFASEGRVMTVRATQDIPKDTELCVSYINLYEPRGVRKQILADTKHFDCSCVRCSEPLKSSIDRFLEAAMCSVKGCDGVQVKSISLAGRNYKRDQGGSSWECDVCSRVANPVSSTSFPGKNISGVDKPWELEIEAENRLATAMAVYGERKFKDARVLLERFLTDFSGKLHPLHVFLFDALTPLMNCCRALGDAGEAARVCRNIITSLEKVVPGNSLELANFYFCLGEMYIERADESSTSPAIAKRYRKQGQEAFQKVRLARKICVGKANLPS